MVLEWKEAISWFCNKRNCLGLYVEELLFMAVYYDGYNQSISLITAMLENSQSN